MDIRGLCNLYGIQSQLLNDPGNKTYSNQRDAMRGLFFNAAIPELEDLRDELNRWFVPGYAKNEKLFFDFDLDGVPELQDDINQLVTSMTQAWWLTPNEKRINMNYDMSEEGGMDQIWIPTGLMPINENIVGGEDLTNGILTDNDKE